MRIFFSVESIYKRNIRQKSLTLVAYTTKLIQILIKIIKKPETGLFPEKLCKSTHQYMKTLLLNTVFSALILII
jgi:hypothetical protein